MIKSCSRVSFEDRGGGGVSEQAVASLFLSFLLVHVQQIGKGKKKKVTSEGHT